MKRSIPARLSALILLLLPWLARGTAPAGDPLDYVRVGQGLAQRAGLDPGALPADAFQAVLTATCQEVVIGPLRIYVPADAFGASGGKGLAALQLAVPAALRALAQIGDWSGEEGVTLPTAKEWKSLEEGIEMPKDFDPALPPVSWTLEGLLGKDLDKQELALLAKVESILACKLLVAPAEGAAHPDVPLLVLPTRRHMVEFLCLAGVVDPRVAPVFHQPAITGWMHSYYGALPPLGRVNVLCLEEGHVGDGAIERWTEASQDTDRMLVRHSISYDALVALLAGLGPAVPNWLALGLGFQGVLEQYGNLAGRLGADSVGDVTPPRQAFVPGGQSNGGRFPPNLSALRGTLVAKDLMLVLEQRKQAAYERLRARDASDPQRKAAQSGDEVVFLHLRASESDTEGYLHFGPYLGQDLSFLNEQKAGHDLALTQRALFALVAVDLAEREKGAALARLLASIPTAAEDFAERFATAVGATPTDLERALFAKVKKK